MSVHGQYALVELPKTTLLRLRTLRPQIGRPQPVPGSIGRLTTLPAEQSHSVDALRGLRLLRNLLR